MQTTAPANSLERDVGIMSLVGFAHLVSHFFQLILAPLFPWLREAFALSYAELGLIMSVLFTVSAVGQAIAGFIVDRWGALLTLNCGLACLTVGTLVLATANVYPALLVGAVLIGFGNAVFHPVDFWLINHKISIHRLGPAFSVHGLTGSLGWAAAPVFLVSIAVAYDWRTALYAAAVIPVLVIIAALRYRHLLESVERDGEAQVSNVSAREESIFAFLKVPTIWLCFVFFALVSAALGGIQSFSPTVFSVDYGFAVGAAAMSVTIYMLASGVGMMTGGWLVLRSQRLEQNITIALAAATLAAIVIGSQIAVPWLALSLMAVMGFGSGLSGPSRDMLIRKATPAGATGRVYGVVYSGLDAGIATGPVVLGRMLDAGAVSEIYFAVAVFLAAAVVVAWRVVGMTATAEPHGA